MVLNGIRNNRMLEAEHPQTRWCPCPAIAVPQPSLAEEFVYRSPTNVAKPDEHLGGAQNHPMASGTIGLFGR